MGGAYELMMDGQEWRPVPRIHRRRKLRGREAAWIEAARAALAGLDAGELEAVRLALLAGSDPVPPLPHRPSSFDAQLRDDPTGFWASIAGG